MILKLGSKGEEVKALQGLTAYGARGENVRAMAKEYLDDLGVQYS